MESLAKDIAACRICADRFAATATAHKPRPVFWVRPGARILIAGQAPGARVHDSGRPFTDPSGDRLREWTGLDQHTFYDRSQVAILPMAFCFPGYNAKGADLPPPPVCAQTWRQSVLAELGSIRLTLLIGAHAQNWHLENKVPVSKRVQEWRAYGPNIFPLPHPSWRNNHWLKQNPWFSDDLLPALRKRVHQVLHDD